MTDCLPMTDTLFPSRPARALPRLAAFTLTLALGLAWTATADAAARKPGKSGASTTRAALVKTRHQAQPAPAAQAYGERADLMRFADELAAARGWEAAPLRELLAQARLLPQVQKLMMPPPAGTAKDWGAYRARFVEPRRLQAGLAFWSEHEAALARAEAQYGVPAHIVAGVIGVETFYGRIMGGFRVLDALATLAFDFPSGRRDRSPFFREELAEFLALTRREGLDPLTLKGSYAGALGWGQFMPGSWNRHAVDFDGDGKVDLINSPVDAIGSVAHYLAQHGWQRGLPTDFAVQAPVDTRERARLMGPDILPSFSAAELEAAGARLDEAGRAHTGPLALIELQMGDAAPVYVAGTQNFYAITRYNQSSYYAMAVIELGRTLAQWRGDAARPGAAAAPVSAPPESPAPASSPR